MLPVAGKPFVHYQLDWLASEGVTDVVYCIGYRGETIRDYVGDRQPLGRSARSLSTKANASWERPERCAWRSIRASSIPLSRSSMAILSCAFRLPAMWQRFEASGHPALDDRSSQRRPLGSQQRDLPRRPVILYDKNADPRPDAMQYIDYGISVLRRDVIEQQVPSGERSDLAPLLHRLSVDGRLAASTPANASTKSAHPQGLEDFEQYILIDATRAPRASAKLRRRQHRHFGRRTRGLTVAAHLDQECEVLEGG